MFKKINLFYDTVYKRGSRNYCFFTIFILYRLVTLLCLKSTIISSIRRVELTIVLTRKKGHLLRKLIANAPTNSVIPVWIVEKSLVAH